MREKELTPRPREYFRNDGVGAAERVEAWQAPRHWASWETCALGGLQGRAPVPLASWGVAGAYIQEERFREEPAGEGLGKGSQQGVHSTCLL